MQGGGVYVTNANVTISDTQIYSNSASGVCARFLNFDPYVFHCPHWSPNLETDLVLLPLFGSM